MGQTCFFLEPCVCSVKRWGFPVLPWPVSAAMLKNLSSQPPDSWDSRVRHYAGPHKLWSLLVLFFVFRNLETSSDHPFCHLSFSPLSFYSFRLLQSASHIYVFQCFGSASLFPSLFHSRPKWGLSSGFSATLDISNTMSHLNTFWEVLPLVMGHLEAVSGISSSLSSLSPWAHGRSYTVMTSFLYKHILCHSWPEWRDSVVFSLSHISP